MSIVNNLGGGVAAVLIIKHLDWTIDGLVGTDIADMLRAATLRDAVASLFFWYQLFNIFVNYFVIVLFLYLFFLFLHRYFFCDFVVYLLYFNWFMFLILNQKETLKLVHIYCYVHGASNFGYKLFT